MSALAGVLEFGPARRGPRRVQAITAAMACNGRDGIAHWHGGAIALGHCSLDTTHEAALEAQPLVCDRTGYVLVLDGRLDNRDHLRRELVQRGFTPRNNTDAELVLRAYEAWGVHSPHHLLGDFAFALWDAPRQRLFCATDTVGACPLFYTRTDDFFAFASVDEALLALPGVDASPDGELIAHLLVPQFMPRDTAASWLKHVKALPPGHSMMVTATGTRVSKYFEFQPGNEMKFQSAHDAQEAFLDVFDRAVDDRIRARGPVAQMLSGGLDSASIYAAATRHAETANSLQTYSLVSDDPGVCIETQCIGEITTRHGNTHFAAVPSITGELRLSELCEQLWGGAHPRENSLPLPAMLCHAASRDGHRVMLHGVSGDVTQATPDRYIAETIRQGAWKASWREARSASDHHTYLRGNAPWSLFAANAATALVPGVAKAAAHRWAPQQSPLRSSLINPDFANRMSIAARLREDHLIAAASRRESANPRSSQARLLNSRSGPSLGMGGFARLAKRYGMDLRDPWADRRVIQFFLDLPMRHKVNDGWTKHLVRTAFDGTLPSSVLRRVGKEHLGWQLVRRLVEESSELLNDLFSNDLDLVGEYVNTAVAQQVWNRRVDVRKRTYFAEEQDSQLVYEIATLVLWIKRLPNRR